MMKISEKEALMEELKELSTQMGYRIRFEKGDFSGGMCLLKDENLLVVNKRFSLDRRIAIIARALAEIGIEDVYVKPAIRLLIEDEISKGAE